MKNAGTRARTFFIGYSVRVRSANGTTLPRIPWSSVPARSPTLYDYAFFYDESSITFYVDGEPMQEFEGGLPEKRMKLYVNTWFPTWLDGEEPDSDRYAYVDWIER